MMMMPKKASATMIVSKMIGKDGGGKDPMDMFSLKDAIHRGNDEMDDDQDMMQESIMEDFIKAIEKKDAQGAAEALKNFIMVCDSDEGEPGEEGPEEENEDSSYGRR